MKKLICVLLMIFLLMSLASCGTTDEPKVISPKEYAALDEHHMVSLNVGMILSESWEDANEIAPSNFMYYYASTVLQKKSGVEAGWKDGYLIPEEELETAMQKHFDVNIDHLRTNEYYLAEEHAYEFGGLGSVTYTVVTNAVLNGNILTIDYDVNGSLDYLLARGTFEMEVGGGDIFSEDYKLLSNRIEWSAQSELAFPSAMGERDYYGVFMMESGGRSGRGPSRDDLTWYDGEDINSIIAFYENEALPALEADGSADLTVHEGGGWYWSGTYRGGTPLIIDVRRKFGSNSYIIAVQHDGTDNSYIADNMREDFMQPPNTNDFEEIGGYLWPVFSAGVLDTAWSTGENVEIPALVALYAESLSLEDGEEPENSYPAEYVELYAQRVFEISTDRMRRHSIYSGDDLAYNYEPYERSEAIHIVSALSYGREDESDDASPIRMVIAYEVTPSEEDKTVLWSGELEVELSSGGYKYLSNSTAPSGSTTSPQDSMANDYVKRYPGEYNTELPL